MTNAGSPAVGPAEMTYFDLTSLSHQRAARVHGLRVAWSVLLVVFAIMIVAIGAGVTLHALHTRYTPFQDLVAAVLEGGFAFAICLGVVALWKSGRGAVGLTVDAEGVQFRWASGRDDLLPWGEMKGQLVLLDYSADVGNEGSNPMTPYEAHRWSRTPTQLSEEAFDAIILRAGALGIRTTRVFQKHPRWWPPCIEVRFGLRPYPAPVRTGARTGGL